MKKDIAYYSKDKMYKLKSKESRFSLKNMSILLLLLATILLVFGIIFLKTSIQINGKKIDVGYSENGNVDYTVYLKDNTFYDTKYLTSGMQYVASLINTINAKFNYEIHSDENLDYNYTYKIIGTLQIMDKTDSSKVLYTKDYKLLDEVKKTANSNNFVINEDVIINYNKYNNYVNSYKSEYGLSVNSQLVLKMYVDVEGNSELSEESLTKNNELQMTIPLSEQTVDIIINTDEISNSGNLATLIGLNVNNILILLIGMFLIMISLILFFIDRTIFRKYRKENIYSISLNKILRDYDRIIVNGNVSIDESMYSNKVFPDKFSEMVDASQRLNVPILYYDVIPGEKCFFIIAKDDTLYKYRLTKAYLEGQEEKLGENKDDQESIEILK